MTPRPATPRSSIERSSSPALSFSELDSSSSQSDAASDVGSESSSEDNFGVRSFDGDVDGIELDDLAPQKQDRASEASVHPSADSSASAAAEHTQADDVSSQTTKSSHTAIGVAETQVLTQDIGSIGRPFEPPHAASFPVDVVGIQAELASSISAAQEMMTRVDELMAENERMLRQLSRRPVNSDAVFEDGCPLPRVDLNREDAFSHKHPDSISKRADETPLEDILDSYQPGHHEDSDDQYISVKRTELEQMVSQMLDERLSHMLPQHDVQNRADGSDLIDYRPQDWPDQAYGRHAHFRGDLHEAQRGEGYRCDDREHYDAPWEPAYAPDQRYSAWGPTTGPYGSRTDSRVRWSYVSPSLPRRSNWTDARDERWRRIYGESSRGWN